MNIILGGMWLTVRYLSDTYYPVCKGWGLHIPFVSIRRPEDLEVTDNYS